MKCYSMYLVLLVLSVLCWPSSQQEAALCVYREYAPTTPELFGRFAGNGCYDYGPDSRFNVKLRALNYPDPNDGIIYPCLAYFDPEANKTVPVFFNPDDPRASKMIAASFVEDRFFDNWVSCYRAAEACCSSAVSDQGGEGQCPHTWDGWQCWGTAAPQTVQQAPCPDYAYTSTPPSCTYYANKECFANGTWFATTNYEGCNIVPNTKTRLIFQISMLGISIGSVFPAIVICFSYKKLRVLRVTLHRNLMCAIVIRSILTISIKAGIILEALLAVDSETTVMEGNGVGCRLLAVSEKLSGNAVFACMLLESIFLHRLIAAAMKGVPRMRYYFIGAAVAVCVPVLAWAISRAVVDDTDCWVVDSSLQWINDGPRIALLSVNTILLIDIIRVLLTKLRHVTSARSGYIRRTTKATLMLAPVFGINILLTAYRPQPDSCTAEQAYYFFSYFMEGMQGFIVALLYVYLNKEVQSLLQRSYVNMKIKIFDFFRCDDATERARQELHVLIRRLTLLTNVDGWNQSVQEANSNKMKTQSSNIEKSPTLNHNENSETVTIRNTTRPRRLTITCEEPTEVEIVATPSDQIHMQENGSLSRRVTVTFNDPSDSSDL
ncbi:calcitonin gene-related peptide type 1 receptor-like [Schistocerca piceifrons]|uniref:calcitonin gene-related peptide type 1 receptor-like n=1 Tax=Schistocerca piceifrons TaxID=274613 RepID=UPI001F5E933F|nr:calcitonin gene-related peptide type 1 receptor-like [Schistocerca piceifrons]